MLASLCPDAGLFRMMLMLARKRESGRFVVLKGFLLLISESCHINLGHTDNSPYGITNSWISHCRQSGSCLWCRTPVTVMVRTAVAAASAAHRARANRQSESSRAHASSLGGPNGSYHATQGYGTISDASNPPASYGVAQSPDHHAPSLSSPRPAMSALPASDSYHGQLHRADSPIPATDDTSDAASTSSSSSLDETGRQLPSYTDFKLAHYLLDLPLTLLILSLFLILAIFGWPVPDSPYPHHIHWKQLGLGAITWISTEAIRRRIFRFLGSSRYPLLRSTPSLLLIHTFTQELLRLFAIRLTFHHGDRPDYGYTPPPVVDPPLFAGLTVIGSGLLGPPPRPPKGFFKAFHLALGFAAAENIWQTLMMLGQVRLYEGELAYPNFLV